MLYSYPFWFINAFALVNLGFGYFVNKNLKIGKSISIDYATIICVLSYIIIHTPLFSIIPYPLPLSLDCAFGAFVYYYVGYRLKGVNMELNRTSLILLILPFVFIGYHIRIGWNYHINMKDVEYNSLLLDLLLPLSFIYLFYIISILLKKVTGVSKLLAYVGRSSMTIFFTHAATLFFFNKQIELWLSTSLAIVVGVCIHILLTKSKYTRLLFLGISPK